MDENSIASATLPLLEEKTANKGGRADRAKSSFSEVASCQTTVPYNRFAYNPEGWPGRSSDAKAHLSNGPPKQRIMATNSIMDAIIENDDNCHNESSERKVSSDEDEQDPVQLDGNANIEDLKSHYEAKIAKLSDDKASKQQQESLGEIRARTMYRMVEDVEVGDTKKLLFLTNKQAQMLSESESNIDKILDALEVRNPKLVINLLMDNAGGCSSLDPAKSGWGLGFQTAEKARAAFFRLVAFMVRVIIPQAVKTRALILCSACNNSILSCALLEALATMESKTKERIKVLGFATSVCCLAHTAVS